MVSSEMNPYEEALADLPVDRLAALVRHRGDVRVRPIPRTYGHLAQRLLAPGPLGEALGRANADQIAVSQTLASHDGACSVDRLALDLDTTTAEIVRIGRELELSGLGWSSVGWLHQPEILTRQWLFELGNPPPVASLVRKIKLDDLRRIVAGLGLPTAGLTRPKLAAVLTSLYTDRAALRARIAGLDAASGKRLRGTVSQILLFGSATRVDPIEERLIAAGLMLPDGWHQVVPREVAVLVWLHDQDARVTGPPGLPRAPAPAETGRAAQFVAEVTRVLDQVRIRPLARLKKVGIGRRVLRQLATTVDLTEPVVALALAVAHEEGLLTETEAGYTTTDRFPSWRAGTVAERWAAAVLAWCRHRFLPTAPPTEAPPALGGGYPLGGAIRDAVLRVGRPEHSVRAAAERLDWYAPLLERDSELTAAALTEAELVGMLSDDAWTAAGCALLECIDADDPATAIAARIQLGGPGGDSRVVVQADLTAIVTGQPDLAVLELLAASADSESSGAASCWRFSPASVRRAFDQGWTADGLLAELDQFARPDVPQPLRFLINDVARTYGAITIRPAVSCLVADEPTIAELMTVKSLRKLKLTRLAPTVMISGASPEELITAVRAAGHAPVLHDDTGAVIIERGARDALTARPLDAPRSSAKASVDELLAVVAEGKEDPESETQQQIRKLDHQLNDSELILLADSIDQSSDLVINYRNKQGNYSTRAIRPKLMYGRWLVAHCHLRDAEREFTIANVINVWPTS